MMKISLPVQMFPLSMPASKSGGFVLCVLIGLALFMTAQQKNKQAN
jgi:hypothetical protein